MIAMATPGKSRFLRKSQHPKKKVLGNFDLGVTVRATQQGEDDYFLLMV